MMDEPKKCTVCNGRGYFHCKCWPADCICGYDDEDCDECEGTGYISDDMMYDDYDEPFYVPPEAD